MESLAIVGISFKLPHGAVDEQSLWRILEERMNVSTAWPSERVNLQPFFDRNVRFRFLYIFPLTS